MQVEEVAEATAHAVGTLPRWTSSAPFSLNEVAGKVLVAIHIVKTKSGRAIQDQEPDLVVQAIRFALDRVHAP